jgi:polyhydroxybutyrate depolymerase
MANRVGKLGAIAVAIVLLVHLAHAAEPSEVMTWKVDGETRRALVYSPSIESANKAPLVLSFHGRGDNMQNFQHTNMHLSGWQVERGQDADRDLKLVDVAFHSLRDRLRVDESRIYATGFSNGAGFTYLLWAERPAVFAAFAPVAGRLRPSVQPKEQKPIFHIAGTADETTPFASQQEAIDAAKRVDGVTGGGTGCGRGCTIYGSGVASVMTWIHPGGHEYPSGTSERIAKFFRDYRR